MKKLVLLAAISTLSTTLFADMSAEGIAGTTININGYLCAEVVELNKLASGNFEATCIKFRGGSSEATHIVDATSGKVFSK